MEQMSLRTQSSLDLRQDALEEISSQVTKLVSEYIATISERPVRAENYAGKTTSEIATELSAEGLPLEQLLAECRTIMDLSRHNGHPRFFGYVASPSTPVGAYGDLIASALNANITCWRSGPAGTELERLVVRWLGALIGYDAQANGLLTSGGSMANMIALMIASRSKFNNASRQGLWNAGPPMTVYASEEVHMRLQRRLTFSVSDEIKCARSHATSGNECVLMRCDKVSRLICARVCVRFAWLAVRGLLTPASWIHWRRSQTLRVSLNCGFTLTARMVRLEFWTSARNTFLPGWTALIPFHSIHTSGFTFRLMRAVFCFVMLPQPRRRSVRTRPITSRRMVTWMKKRLRSGITVWSYRVAFVR
jgi:hypothetical protein